MGGFPPVRRLALPAALNRHITQRTPEKAYAFSGVFCVTKPRWSGRPCSAPDAPPPQRWARGRIPDGREGFDTLFLRHGFNVCVSDAVERGRASWAKFPEINPVPPCFNSYAERWTTYRLGPKYPESYEGTRFDADKYDAFIKSGHDA